jgi:short-subunit dehydrogenase
MNGSSGKTALITGASEGLGRDLAELFARDGHGLVLVARNESRLNELAGKLREEFGVTAEVIAEDLSVPGAAQRVMDRVGGRAIDFLVNNAGFGTHGMFAESEVASQVGMLEVNVVALTHLTRLVLPGMIERRAGRIMNMASVAGMLPGPMMAVYYASKAYVISFSEALANEMDGKGITVTAVCPGPTVTEFQKRAGIEASALFKRNVMTSMAVAQIGYRAMMRGKRVAVTGWSNRFMAMGMKFMPRRLTAAVARKLNESR